jgi:NTE family protein
MREKLAAKGVTTFRQLRYEDGASPDPRYRHKVQVIVSDVTNRRLLRLPMDAKAVLGVEPDDLPVAEAVRMSMSIPFFFSPVRWKHPDGKQQLTLVDGGMLSNFPVWLFDTPDLPDWPTFGLRLVTAEARDGGGLSLPVPLPPNTGRLLSYALTLVQTMLAAHDRLYLDSETYARTIGVPTGNASGTDFALSEATKRQLYEAGRAAATEFLDQQWSFAEYIATFRTGARPHRRDILKDAMARIAAGAPLPDPVAATGDGVAPAP